jgi:hypothetical protein
MKMTRVRWSVVVPILVVVGWLSLYVIDERCVCLAAPG